jgi:hypothetical protein
MNSLVVVYFDNTYIDDVPYGVPLDLHELQAAILLLISAFSRPHSRMI